ncbi:hypothetical protein ACMHYB_36730 [Sorangium sp. So ce1128]
MDDAQARRMARASWETQIFRNDPQGEADADARFWARMSPAERVLAAWALSQEMHALAHPDAPAAEPGFSRSIVRIIRG